jgi:hypothetical protein
MKLLLEGRLLSGAGRRFPLTEPESLYHLYSFARWPTDTAVTMYRLMCAGYLERWPDLKIITHHSGGTVPMIAGRLKRPPRWQNAEPRIPLQRQPLDYLRQFYADTGNFGNRSPCGRRSSSSERITCSSARTSASRPRSCPRPSRISRPWCRMSGQAQGLRGQRAPATATRPGTRRCAPARVASPAQSSSSAPPSPRSPAASERSRAGRARPGGEVSVGLRTRACAPLGDEIRRYEGRERPEG